MNSAKDEMLELFGAVALGGQTLGALFLTDPKEAAFEPLFEQLTALSSLEDWPFGSEGELARAYKLFSEGTAEGCAALGREYQRLFIGPHHFEAPAWGSVYLDRDQILFGNSTLELDQWMRVNGIAINEDKKEPVDHIGKMLVLLGWLAQEKPDLLAEYLAEHLMPWAPRYLELLEADARSPFYEGLAVLTRVTLDGVVRELGVTPAKKQLYS